MQDQPITAKCPPQRKTSLTLHQKLPRKVRHWKRETHIFLLFQRLCVGIGLLWHAYASICCFNTRPIYHKIPRILVCVTPRVGGVLWALFQVSLLVILQLKHECCILQYTEQSLIPAAMIFLVAMVISLTQIESTMKGCLNAEERLCLVCLRVCAGECVWVFAGVCCSCTSLKRRNFFRLCPDMRYTRFSLNVFLKTLIRIYMGNQKSLQNTGTKKKNKEQSVQFGNQRLWDQDRTESVLMSVWGVINAIYFIHITLPIFVSIS